MLTGKFWDVLFSWSIFKMAATKKKYEKLKVGYSILDIFHPQKQLFLAKYGCMVDPPGPRPIFIPPIFIPPFVRYFSLFPLYTHFNVVVMCFLQYWTFPQFVSFIIFNTVTLRCCLFRTRDLKSCIQQVGLDIRGVIISFNNKWGWLHCGIFSWVRKMELRRCRPRHR